MQKLTCNERGGIFVELAIALTIFFTFYSGTLAIHKAAARKFRAIVNERNQAITKIRGTKEGSPQFLLGR